MIKKMFVIFVRDLKVNTRDFLSLYIMSAPILFAIFINLLTPSINDTTVNIALVEGENEALQVYMEDFAKVSTYDDLEAVEERVTRRDDVFGLIKEGDSYYVLQQGDELEGLVEYSKLLLTFYQEDVQIDESTAVIHSFDREAPPLKKLLVNIFIMFTSIMGGMIIAMNIIEEKSDRTIRAIHLSPVSRNGYLLGKSMMGALIPLYGTVAMIIITGYTDIDWGKMMLLTMASTVISILVGFIEGINNETVMDAAGSVKMMFIPMAGAVAIAELVGEKWQWVAYWVPFYWTFKGVDDVLTYKAEWGTTLMYTGLVLLISAVVYVILIPKIKKGLS